MNTKHQFCSGGGLGIMVIAAITLLYGSTGLAIPHFAREYKTSCMTCHAGYPKLNRVGENFKKLGFVFPEGSIDGLVKKLSPVALGAPATKAVWPSVTWPGDIPGVPPLAIRMESRYSAGTDAGDGDNFIFPNNIFLLTGGTLSENFSYFGHFHLLSEGESEIGTARAWLRANSLFQDALGVGALNLKVGLVEPAAVPFSQFTSLGITPYAFNTFSPNLNEAHNIRLSGGGAGHHGGGLALGATEAAVEITGLLLDQRLSYGIGITDRDVISAQEEDDGDHDDGGMDMDMDEHGDDGSDFNKDVYGYVDYYLKKQNIKQGELSLWDQTSFKLGIFGKSGRGAAKAGEAMEHDEDGDEDHGDEHEDEPEAFSGVINDYAVLGGSYALTVKNLDVFGGVMNFSAEDTGSVSVDELLFFTEIQYRIFPWCIPYARWESLNTEIHGQDNVERVVPGIALYARANIRFVVEGELYPDNSDVNQLMLSADFAF